MITPRYLVLSTDFFYKDTSPPFSFRCKPLSKEMAYTSCNPFIFCGPQEIRTGDLRTVIIVIINFIIIIIIIIIINCCSSILDTVTLRVPTTDYSEFDALQCAKPSPSAKCFPAPRAVNNHSFR